MQFQGFEYPTGVKKELTPEEKKARALSFLDRPLEDMVKEDNSENDKENKKPRKENKYKNDKHKEKREAKYINLHLTDRELERYLTFADFPTTNCDIKLRLSIKKKSRY